MPKVINVTRERDPTATFIGRGSKWGNPFRITQQRDREHAIMEYIEWVENDEDDTKAIWIRENIGLLRGRDLACFCAPLKCHGDYLLEQANK